MKRLSILFLLVILVISLSALYLYFAGCKEGMDIQKMALDAQKEYEMNQKTKKRLESANK